MELPVNRRRGLQALGASGAAASLGAMNVNLEAAQAQLKGAKAQLGALQAMRSNPVGLQAQVNQASSAYSLTIASVAVEIDGRLCTPPA